MLDQLVESKSNARENGRRGRFMAIVLILAVVTVLGLWTRDLVAHDYSMGGGDLELSTLVAPPPPEDEPPPEKPKEPEKQQKQPDVDVRKELIANINTTPPAIPKEVETKKTNFQAMRENVKTVQGNENITNVSAVPERGAGAVQSGTTLGTGSTGSGRGDDDDEGGAPPPKAPPPAPKPPSKPISGGVLNGKALSLPKPGYPAAARSVHASGTVTVQVTISESGSVISANAVSGHPLLRAAAEQAARGARFSPTLLSGQPVKVTGVITYNFVQ